MNETPKLDRACRAFYTHPHSIAAHYGKYREADASTGRGAIVAHQSAFHRRTFGDSGIIVVSHTRSVCG